VYTQCPDCGTVFRVTAEALRVAQGDVRCGVCSSRFNALESLRDEPRPLFAGTPPEDTITVEELPGNEMIELSSPEAEAETRVPSETGAEATAGAAGEAESLGDEHLPAEHDAAYPAEPAPEALEFHGSAEDLERVFVLAEPDDAARGGAGAMALEAGGEAEDELFLQAFERASRADLGGIEVHEQDAGLGLDTTRDDLDATDEFPVIVFDEAEGMDEPGGRALEVRSVEDELPLAAAGAGPGEQAATGPAAQPEPAAEARFLIPEELRRELAARASPGTDAAPGREAHDILGLPAAGPASGTTRRWPAAAGAMLLIAALAAQAVHFWRDDLARDPLAGPWVLRAYQLLDLPLEPPSDLAAFELRQWGATSDTAQPDRLRLRASIVNRAAFAQPYPLLRLSLQDRFGNTIGVRDVSPADYLPGGATSPAHLLRPGQRADAEIVFLDPGRDAVGYELDLCLPAGDGVRCASPAAASP
jgi:predicted Zn finger-like uncharacterized protein